MDGLIIKKKWLDLILAGKKVWEIRGHNTKKRGQIALIESGSGEVKGVCELKDSFTLQDRHKNMDRFHWLTEYQVNNLRYKNPHVWSLGYAEKINPVKYKHPQGAVIWVKNVL